MSYLTEEEYKKMGFTEISEPLSFDVLLTKASSVLDSVTRNFYKKNNLDTDYPERKQKFKEAVAMQIDYFNTTGETTTEGLNNQPVSQTIGSTTINFGSNQSNSAKKNVICPDIYLHLEWTGLLGRGVRR